MPPGIPSSHPSSEPTSGPRGMSDRDTARGSALAVLVVEDSPVQQLVAQQMVGALGHSADVVADGRAAVRAVDQRDYDVVLMDLEMPGMGGLEATATILARVPDTRRPRILAMTAHSRPEDRRACIRAGMSAVLAKPLRAADLARTLGVVAGSTAVRLDGTAPAAEPAAALDLAVFSQLTMDMGAQSPKPQRDLIDAYLGQAGGSVVELAGAAAQGDTRTVRAIAHQMGSTSALLGALTLASLLDEAGRLARSEEPGLPEAGAAVSLEYQRVAAVLEQHRTSLTERIAREGGES